VFAKRLEGEGLRVESDLESATVGSKIRNAQLQKIPYMLVIGEEGGGGWDGGSVRARDGDVKYGVKVDEFVAEPQGRGRCARLGAPAPAAFFLAAKYPFSGSQ
jgi:threonyl-tRNA synthetase